MGLSLTERSSGSLRVWGSRGLMRRLQSPLGHHFWEQIIGFGNQRVDVGPSALRLSFTRRRCSPQRKPGHVGWCSTGPMPLTRATRNGRWTSDWVSWAGQVRMVRKLERVGWTPPGPRHRSQRPGYGSSNASDGTRRTVVATRLRTLDRVAGAQRALVIGRCYGRSTASAGALRAHATGCGYPDD